MLSRESSTLQHAIQNIALLALSFALLPLDTLILLSALLYSRVIHSTASQNRQRALNTPGFKSRTVLVTGVGMTKGLSIARSFYEAGHTVIGADFEAPGIFVCGRVSRAISRFVPLQKPSTTSGPDPYIDSLLKIIRSNRVDLWVSCSGVASAIEDGAAKEVIEQSTTCKAIQFNVKTTQILHEKNAFIAHIESLGLDVPETHEITDLQTAQSVLEKAPNGRKYIMKPTGMDDANRGDMTLLPLSTISATHQHLARLVIDKDHPWILQQFIKGKEYCTHSICVNGEVELFCACPSAELLMHYEALPADSRLTRAMLDFTRTVAAAGGTDFTGHCSFDFLVEDADLQRLNDEDSKLTLYPIECNPRAHTAVALFNGTPGMAAAYLSLLDSTTASGITNGSRIARIITPTYHKKYYWIGHDLVSLLLLPLLHLLTCSTTEPTSMTDLLRNLDLLLDYLFFWTDGTFETWDPLPWWWLYHVYWPGQFLDAIRRRKKWSRINVSTCKMFEC